MPVLNGLSVEYHGDRFGSSLIGYVGLITVTMAYN